MAVHRLLLRGMFVGVIAGLLAFGFAKIFGEPSIDRAIAFESAHVHHHHAGHAHDEEGPELVGRPLQSTAGLAIGAIVYGGALGGLFALIFALAYGRIGDVSPRTCSAVLALLCFVAVFAAPYLKYPANPPAVGGSDTIGPRTGLFFAMIAISIAAMMAAFSLRRWMTPSAGLWNASLAGVLAFVVLVATAALVMPSVDEVPAGFPATTLWRFRLAAFGMQAVLWGTIGLLFGILTERDLRS